MNTADILKTAGLLTALSFSSITLVSCDDNDSNSSNDIAEPTSSLLVGDIITLTNTNGGRDTSFEIISESNLLVIGVNDSILPEVPVNYIFEANNPNKLTIFAYSPELIITTFNNLLSDPTSELSIAVNSGNTEQIIDVINLMQGEGDLPRIELGVDTESSNLGEFLSTIELSYTNNFATTATIAITVQTFNLNNDNLFELGTSFVVEEGETPFSIIR